MQNSQYRIGVITNVHGQVMNDLTQLAKSEGVTFDQITFPYIPLSDLNTSDFISRVCEYDIVYYRTGMKGSAVAELTHILNQRSIPMINGITKEPFMHLKSRQALIAGRHNIQQPRTCQMSKHSYETASSIFGDTFVIKPDDGSKGTDVQLVKSQDDFEMFRQTRKKTGYIYQAYLSEAEEYRVYTLGSKGIASYKKVLGDGDFRANLHVGATMTKTEPERLEKLLSFGGQVAEAFGSDISGVDILYKDNQCYFLELNWQPGWEQLDELSGANYSRKTLQYILDKAHHFHSSS
jgi:glutathione synthase/RimK-type ligase-like ATP-grasp enzyme